MSSPFTQLIETVIIELREMSYEDALENFKLLEELQTQVNEDIDNIIENS